MQCILPSLDVLESLKNQVTHVYVSASGTELYAAIPYNNILMLTGNFGFMSNEEINKYIRDHLQTV